MTIENKEILSKFVENCAIQFDDYENIIYNAISVNFSKSCNNIQDIEDIFVNDNTDISKYTMDISKISINQVNYQFNCPLFAVKSEMKKPDESIGNQTKCARCLKTVYAKNYRFFFNQAIKRDECVTWNPILKHKHRIFTMPRRRVRRRRPYRHSGLPLVIDPIQSKKLASLIEML